MAFLVLPLQLDRNGDGCDVVANGWWAEISIGRRSKAAFVSGTMRCDPGRLMLNGGTAERKESTTEPVARCRVRNSPTISVVPPAPVRGAVQLSAPWRSRVRCPPSACLLTGRFNLRCETDVPDGLLATSRLRFEDDTRGCDALIRKRTIQ
jgi:hypothetical protein